MNFQQLQENLSLKAGKVTIAQDTLTANIPAFLKTYYANQPIVITEATQEIEGEDALVISGTSTFLNVANLPVSARFSLDAQGNAQVLFSYTLRGEMPGPNAWRFTTSFPQLPSVVNYNTPLPEVIDENTDIVGKQIP